MCVFLNLLLDMSDSEDNVHIINFYLCCVFFYFFYSKGSFFSGQNSRNNEEVTLIRKADLENHNKDGGFWTVIDGKVYDIKDFQAQSLHANTILGMCVCFCSFFI